MVSIFVFFSVQTRLYQQRSAARLTRSWECRHGDVDNGANALQHDGQLHPVGLLRRRGWHVYEAGRDAPLLGIGLHSIKDVVADVEPSKPRLPGSDVLIVQRGDDGLSWQRRTTQQRTRHVDV